jgi:hypothetical protein
VSAEGFPPPPPPGLSPPPGFAGYAARPWDAVMLKRTGSLSKAILILLGVVAVGQVLSLVFIPRQLDSARDYLADRIDEDEFLERQIGFTAATALVGLATLAVAVLSVIWLYRVAANHRALQRRTTWGPGWAIWGWLLPPFLYVIPTLMLREHWKAAAPSVNVGDDSWRRTPEPVLVWVWFVVYSLAPLVITATGGALVYGGFSSDADDIADEIVDGELALWLGSVATIAGAVLWGLVVHGLTARHRAFTGETTAR